MKGKQFERFFLLDTLSENLDCQIWRNLDERTFHHSNPIEFTSSNKQIFENIVTNIANSSQMLGVGTSTPRKQSIHRSSILFFSFCQNFNERNVSSFYEFTLSNKLLANISTDVMAISRFLSQCKCFLCVRIVPQHPCQRYSGDDSNHDNEEARCFSSSTVGGVFLSANLPFPPSVVSAQFRLGPEMGKQ